MCIFFRERRWGHIIACSRYQPDRSFDQAFDDFLIIVNRFRNCSSPWKNTSFQFDLLKFKLENNQESKKTKNRYFFLYLHAIPLLRDVLILWALILDPSAYASGAHVRKSSGVEIEREVRCARRQNQAWRQK